MCLCVTFYVGEPNLVPPLFQPIIDSQYILLTCGQNITLSPAQVHYVSFACIIFSGAQPVTTEIYKNGESMGSALSRTVILSGDDDFGKYTFVASTTRCGSISTESWILPGKFLLATNVRCNVL